MNQSIVFQNTTFSVVDRDGQPWLLASEISSALGYSRSDKIGRLYERNKDEFTHDMTAVVETPTLGDAGNLKTESRIFSPRGCYALAMFARTTVAKEFRRWVLDVLESIRKTGGYQIPGTKKALPGKLTASSQDLIKQAVRERVESLPKEKWGGASVTLWSAIGTKFGTRGVKDGYKNIPDEALSEIMSLVARTPLSGEYIEREALTDEETNQLAVNALVGKKFALSFTQMEDGSLMPDVFCHHKDARSFVPAGVVRDIRDRTFNFFPDDMIPDLISAISHRLRVAA